MAESGVAPTRMALTLYKTKRLGAVKGFELLKKKSDALKASKEMRKNHQRKKMITILIIIN